MRQIKFRKDGAMRERGKFIGLWLDEREYKYLLRQCSNSGLSTSAFVRNCIMGVNLLPRPPDTYAALLRQLSGIGTNLNQIAHIANSKRDISPDSLEEAIRLARQAWRAVKDNL